jgi:zinc protease
MRGMPVFHVPSEGPNQAALMFRVGTGDEGGADAGITHLVEHLALVPFGQRAYSYNAIVDSMRTVFLVAGSGDECAEHLAAVCRNLAALPLDRLETEARVLRDEASRRLPSAVDHHGWLRWGLRGPGRDFAPEYGLWRLGAAEIGNWSSQQFTVDNAALVWVGSRVPSIDFALPVGQARPLPELVDLVAGRVWAVGADNGVATSFRVPRTTSAAAGQRILGRRLQQRLRYESGLSYEVHVHYQPLSSREAFSTIAASCSTADAEAVRQFVLETTNEMAAVGPDDEELDADREAMRRALAHPQAQQADADRRAFQALLGASDETAQQQQVELDAVTADEVRVALSEAMRTLVLTQPGTLAPPVAGLDPYPNVIAVQQPEGERFYAAAEKAFAISWSLPALVISETGLGIDVPEAEGAWIPWNEVAVAAYGPDGAVSVVHESGSAISIVPSVWRDSPHLQQLLMRALPADRTVVMAEQAVVPKWPGTPIPATSAVWATVVSCLLVFAGSLLLYPYLQYSREIGAIPAGLAYLGAGFLLPLATYGARNFRSWSLIASAGTISFLSVPLVVGVEGAGASVSLFTLPVIGLLAAHVWKTSFRRVIARGRGEAPIRGRAAN